MLVGVYHFANPGRDVVNVNADDVLSPKRQNEIAAIRHQLGQFGPTIVAVEEESGWSGLESANYAAFTAGQRDSVANERDQIGFRLAQSSGARVVAVDVKQEVPYAKFIEAVQVTAPTLWDAIRGEIQGLASGTEDALRTGTIADALLFLNSDKAIASSSNVYMTPLAVTADEGATLPGVDVATAWYDRNLRICARILSVSRPGERVLVLYGFSHIAPLRQCLSGAGMQLVDPNPYLSAAR